MKLSTKGKYSLYAMHYLAEHYDEGPQPLKAIAAIGVPEDYLEQLLGTLRKAGLVSTARGAQGGYALASAPESVTVGDILNATEGPLTISDCLSDESRCDRSGGCKARRVWDYLSRSINGLLDSITLKDMLEQEAFGTPAQQKEQN
ncbi:MAG: Rrf2 family transcriptional regulator [Clostridia bacterium]|nr:Rrf2 family transcriptional regulator [Clostridia bacterium]